MGHKEGRRIKSGHPMDAITPFIMTTRTSSSNQFSYSIDITKCEEIINQKKEEGHTHIGMMHLFMAAYTRVVATLPGINRFIRGQRLYARNSIDLCLTIKKELSLNAQETVIKISPPATATIDDIYQLLDNEIEVNRNKGDTNDMDSTIRLLTKLPRFLLNFAMWVIRKLDYHGILPSFLTRVSPFHGSLYLTNLGSLGIPPVFHHLYDFGTVPVFMAMGAKRTEYVVNKDGNVEKHRLIDFTITCDERICDGHYYATAFKKFKRLLEHPERLNEPPEEVIEDIK